VKKIIKYALISVIFMIILLLVFSCGLNSSYLTVDGLDAGDKNFRESFLKVENKFSAKECENDKCTIERVISSASAFVVSSGKSGAYAITAAHFCEDDMDLLLQSVVRGNPIEKIQFYAYDIDMKRYDINVVTYDRKLDLCLVYVKKLQRKPVLISQTPPNPGDKTYNLAAPMGMFNKNMIPKLDGYFAGYHHRGPGDKGQPFAIYSVPAIGGSSGSPLFNKDGYIIGMIHSVNIRFPFLTYSPTHEQLRKYISENVPY
jgi:S1-C subfamily serine protease